MSQRSWRYKEQWPDSGRTATCFPLYSWCPDAHVCKPGMPGELLCTQPWQVVKSVVDAVVLALHQYTICRYKHLLQPLYPPHSSGKFILTPTKNSYPRQRASDV
jgi:hypothetical protein